MSEAYIDTLIEQETLIHRRAPTALQLVKAAETAARFAASRELTPEERTHVLNAGALMGMAALALERQRA